MAKSLKELVAEAKSRIREISAPDAAEEIRKNPKILVLDVREPGEYAQEHLPAALQGDRFHQAHEEEQGATAPGNRAGCVEIHRGYPGAILHAQAEIHR